MGLNLNSLNIEPETKLDDRMFSRLSRQSLQYLMSVNGVEGWNVEMPKTDLVKICELEQNKELLVTYDAKGDYTYNNVEIELGSSSNISIKRPAEHIKAFADYKEEVKAVEAKQATGEKVKMPEYPDPLKKPKVPLKKAK